jgi:polar amino acid transport system substrate-binding protein
VFKVLLIAIGISFSYGAAALDKATLTFTYAYPADHPQTKRLIRLVKEATSRAGFDFAFEHNPAKRATRRAINGLVDGEMIRVRQYGVLHPELVRVEEHHTEDRFIAYVIDPKIKLDGWNSLKGRDFKIDYRRGVMAPTQNLPNVVPKKNLTVLNSVDSAFRRLFLGRSDIFVDSEGSSENFLNSDAYKIISEGRKIYRAGNMLVTTGHVWLHNKHRHLAPKLSGEFRKMKLELPHLFKQAWDQ